MTTRTWIRGLTAMLAVALALGVAACGDDDNGGGSASAPSGQPGKGKPALTLGAKNFTEQFILGELYAQALRAKGFTVHLKSNIGSSEITDKALTSGKIDVYPEYTGVILSELAHQTKRPTDADEAYDAAKKFQEGRGYTLLDKTPFFDTDAIAVKQAYAEENGLSSVADLKKLGSKFRLGAPPEFKHALLGTARAEVRVRSGSVVQAARHRPPVQGPGLRQDRRRERVHHRRCAAAEQVHGAQGPGGHLRVPERRAGGVQKVLTAQGTSSPRR